MERRLGQGLDASGVFGIGGACLVPTIHANSPCRRLQAQAAPISRHTALVRSA